MAILPGMQLFRIIQVPCKRKFNSKACLILDLDIINDLCFLQVRLGLHLQEDQHEGAVCELTGSRL